MRHRSRPLLLEVPEMVASWNCVLRVVDSDQLVEHYTSDDLYSRRWLQSYKVTVRPQPRDTDLVEVANDSLYQISSTMCGGSLTAQIIRNRPDDLVLTWSIRDDAVNFEHFSVARMCDDGRRLHIVEFELLDPPPGHRPLTAWVEQLEGLEFVESANRLQLAEIRRDRVQAAAAREWIHGIDPEQANALDAEKALLDADRVLRHLDPYEDAEFRAAAAAFFALILKRDWLGKAGRDRGRHADDVIQLCREALFGIGFNPGVESWSRTMLLLAEAWTVSRSLDRKRRQKNAVSVAVRVVEAVGPFEAPVAWAHALAFAVSYSSISKNGDDERALISELNSAAEAALQEAREVDVTLWLELVYELGVGYSLIYERDKNEFSRRRALALHRSVIKYFQDEHVFQVEPAEDADGGPTAQMQASAAPADGLHLFNMLEDSIARVQALGSSGLPMEDGSADEVTAGGSALYLRPFLDGRPLEMQSRFDRERRRKINSTGVVPKRLSLDLVLHLALLNSVPLIGVGGPQDGAGSVLGLGVTDWRDMVRLAAEDAKVILLVPHDSDAIRWEVAFLIESGFIDKTLLVMPPLSLTHDVRRIWREASAPFSQQGIDLPAYDSRGRIMRLDAKGRVIESWPFSAVWRLELLDLIRPMLLREGAPPPG